METNPIPTPLSLRAEGCLESYTEFDRRAGELTTWEVLRLVRVCGDNPSSQDMMLLAYCYETGKGVPMDKTRAVELCRRSAESGDPIAMQMLALYYRDGIGVPEDQGQMVAWLTKSADQGNPMAMLALAHYYERREIQSERDDKLVLQWYQRILEHECFVYGHELRRYLLRRYGPLATLRYFLDAYESCESVVGKRAFMREIDNVWQDRPTVEQIRDDWRRLDKRERQLASEVETLRAENETLRAENEWMATELRYQPGGPGYREAWADFVDKSSSSPSSHGPDTRSLTPTSATHPCGRAEGDSRPTLPEDPSAGT